MAGNGKRSVLIDVLGDFRKYVQGSKGAEKATSSFEKRLQGVGKAIVSAYAAKAVISWGLDAARAAGDVAESVSKVGVVFEDQAGTIRKWAENAADAFGMSNRQALDAASNFAIFGKSAGKAGDELAGFSTDLVELAADLASFHNTSPEDAIVAISAALRGESEPIRRYGVLLNDATLKQRAMTLGIYNGTGVLTAQQRVLAAQAEILAQTADAQGDFNRTKSGAANQARILSAQYADLQATIGQSLLPVLKVITTVLGEVFGWFNNLAPAQQAVIIGAGLLAGVVLVGASAINALTGALSAMNISLSAAAPWLAAVGAAIGLVTLAVGLFADDTTTTYFTQDQFTESIGGTVTALNLQELAMADARDAAVLYRNAIFEGLTKDAADKIAADSDMVAALEHYGIKLEWVTGLIDGSMSSYDAFYNMRIANANGYADATEEEAAGYDKIRELMRQAAEARRQEIATRVDMAEAGDLESAMFLKAAGILPTLTAETQANVNALIDQAAAAEEAGGATQQVAQHQWNLWDATDAVNTKLYAEAAALEETSSRAHDLKAAIDAVFQPYLSMEEATLKWEEGLDKLNATLEENGSSLDASTEAGRANRQAIKDQVEAALAYGTAMVGNGATNEEATAAINLQTEAIRQQMLATGMTTEQVDAYLASLGLTPENVETTISLAEFDTTKRQLQSTLDQLDDIDEGAKAEIQAAIDDGRLAEAELKLAALAATRTANLNVRVTGGGTITVGPKPGGLSWGIKAYAKGGEPQAGEVALVGEQGPELVTFGSGVRSVVPSARTAAMLGGGRGRPSSSVVVHVAGSVVTERELTEVVAQAVRTANRREQRNTLGARQVVV